MARSIVVDLREQRGTGAVDVGGRFDRDDRQRLGQVVQVGAQVSI